MPPRPTAATPFPYTTLFRSVITPQRPPQPTIGRVTNLTGYALGSAGAPLTMVEFTDLQCPYCRQFAITAFDEIRKNWIDTRSEEHTSELQSQSKLVCRLLLE